jgi:hypothetical protein
MYVCMYTHTHTHTHTHICIHPAVVINWGQQTTAPSAASNTQTKCVQALEHRRKQQRVGKKGIENRWHMWWQFLWYLGHFFAFVKNFKKTVPFDWWIEKCIPLWTEKFQSPVSRDWTSLRLSGCEVELNVWSLQIERSLAQIPQFSFRISSLWSNPRRKGGSRIGETKGFSASSCILMIPLLLLPVTVNIL